MVDQKFTQHVLKKDRYVNARSGNSHFIDLFCSQCKQHIVLYQKDGHGALLRLYLDRIFEPKEFSLLQARINSKIEMPNLKCQKCDALIGIPMVYESEKRLAFRLVHGSFAKKNHKLEKVSAS